VAGSVAQLNVTGITQNFPEISPTVVDKKSVSMLWAVFLSGNCAMAVKVSLGQIYFKIWAWVQVQAFSL
jgi:hypothetical protein